MRVTVITPERIAQETQATAVFFPAADGEMGVLQNHVPLLAELRAGEVRIHSGDGVELLAISGGFVEVRDNQVSIFAETAELAEEIDVERARQAAETAKRKRQELPQDRSLLEAEAAMRRALVRLRVAESHRRRSSR